MVSRLVSSWLDQCQRLLSRQGDKCTKFQICHRSLLKNIGSKTNLKMPWPYLCCRPRIDASSGKNFSIVISIRVQNKVN